MQTILAPDSLWQVLLVQKIIGMFFMNFAIALPFLIRIGMNKRSAFSWIAALIIMVYIPIMATIPSEIFSSGFLLENPSILGLIHVAGALLSGSLGYLIYSHSRLKPSKDRFPILAIYVIWFTLETFQTIHWLFYEFIDMLLLPDLIGSFTILLLLPLVIRWNRNFQEDTKNLSLKYLLLLIPLLFVFTSIGNLVFNFTELNFTNVSDLPLSHAALLIMNIAIIFPYTYLLASLVKQSRGTISIDLLAVFFLSFWFGPRFIKGTYLFWTGGFWIAEIIQVLGLMLGPVAIGILYIHEMQRAETYHRKATLFSDVLVHDISNYHQAISMCLEILEMEESSDE